LEEKQLSFIASSPLAFLEGELCDHPAWVGIVKEKALEPEEMQSLRARALEIFQDANEDLDAFQVTSYYVVSTAVSQERGGMSR
jgi:hypothetical protein